MNTKGDIPSILFAIIAIFIVGVLFFFVNHFDNQLFTEFEEYMNDSTTYNNSVAQEAVVDIRDAENSIYDYAFLIVFLGYFLALALTGYSTRISPLFFWIYGVITLVGLGLGVILSNTWQQMAGNAEFTTTLARFPITNAILGTYYPVVVTGMIAIVMALLFGKNPNEGVR